MDQRPTCEELALNNLDVKSTEWKKTLANHVSDKGLLAKMGKKLPNAIAKNQIIQLKGG